VRNPRHSSLAGCDACTGIRAVGLSYRCLDGPAFVGRGGEGAVVVVRGGGGGEGGGGGSGMPRLISYTDVKALANSRESVCMRQ
jgi:hypothetical protein